MPYAIFHLVFAQCPGPQSVRFRAFECKRHPTCDRLRGDAGAVAAAAHGLLL